MSIPLVDLKAQLPEIREEVRLGFERIIDNTAFILGAEVQSFEEAFAAFCGTRHAIGVGNGTDALELALRAVGVGPGDEVIVPANSFIASALAVARAGGTPVFVDVDEAHQLIDPAKAKSAITSKTKAIMPVHLFGQIAPMKALGKEVAIVEDAAQAQGAKQGDVCAGNFGAIAATSFYPGKNLGAFGDGGAVMTNDEVLDETVRALRNYGSTVKYHHPETGFNSRLDPLQAVVLNAKLKRLAKWNAMRRAAAGRYHEMLEGLNLVRPGSAEGNEHIWHLYVIRVQNRDAVLSKLHDAKIGAGIHYPVPIHLQGAFAHLGHKEGDFPVVEKAAKEILSLPLFPEITADQQGRVVEVLKSAL